MSPDELNIAYATMVTKLAKPGEAIYNNLSPSQANLIHMAMGIVTEAGELMDAVKKCTIYNKPLDLTNCIEELGDLEFYMEGFRQALYLTRESTLEHNMQKLSKGANARYASGSYSDAQAQERADKKIPRIAKIPRILILGHGRHGKDTVAELITDKLPKLTFLSSSYVAAAKVMMPAFEAIDVHYPSVEACYEDRAAHRTFWHESIANYNSPDKTKLAREILDMGSNYGYIGMRCDKEYEACMQANLFDEVVWVSAVDRVPLESCSSFKIAFQADAQYLIVNNADKASLVRRVAEFTNYLAAKYTFC